MTILSKSHVSCSYHDSSKIGLEHLFYYGLLPLQIPPCRGFSCTTKQFSDTSWVSYSSIQF